MSLGTHLLSQSVLLGFICSCSAYRLLLVFPVPSKSHATLGEGFVKHLATAGHEITYVTPLPMKNPPPRVRQIDISENKKYMPIEAVFDTRSLINQEMDLQDATVVMEIFSSFANATIHMNEFQKLLRNPKEKFDAVIVEWLYTELFSGLAVVFNCPLIWSSSMESHSMVLSLIDEYPNPAYTFHHLSRNYGFNFWRRAHELWLLFLVRLYKWRMQSYEHRLFRDMYENPLKMRGKTLPDYEDVRYNGSLLFVNSYVSTGEAISLPQNLKYIGGYHFEKEPQDLPKDLQKIMDNAKHGVIYFSLGSILRSDRIPEHMKKDILNIFSTFNQTVIWKLEEVLPDLPKNVHIVPWAPQTAVLAHPNCVLFITHGGYLSQTEALHYGVPVIGMPLYGDQFLNSNRAEYKGYGKRVDFYNGLRNLQLAIREILENSSYRQRAKEYSFIHHHRPVPPEKELVHWVEHVIRTRGALHLRSPALRVPWYQRYYIDLATVIVPLSFIIISLSKQGLGIYRRHSKEKLS